MCNEKYPRSEAPSLTNQIQHALDLQERARELREKAIIVDPASSPELRAVLAAVAAATAEDLLSTEVEGDLV